MRQNVSNKINNNCLNCNSPVKQIEGKRQRKYCSDSCRQVYWQKSKKKIPVHKSKCIELPPEYYDFKSIGVLDVDGSVKVLGTITDKGVEWSEISDVPPNWVKEYFKKHPEYLVATKAIKTLIIDEIEQSKGEIHKHVPENSISNEDIEKQIKAIKAEKIPSHITTSMGKKAWNFDQQKRINELKNKLNG